VSRPSGTIKRTPEDFAVDEVPAYEPSGVGTHCFVHFRKRNLTTDDAVRAIARALGVERREIGVAGLKDKVAVTTQWVSLPASDGLEARIEALEIPGLEVLAHRRHGNKLKTGHLRGNRFRIVIRDVDPATLPEIAAGLERIARDGVPNAFGVQRFGREGDTHERARAWLTGREPAPRDPRLRRFHFSALQSSIFNAVLAERVADGSWCSALLGDVMKKEETGGLFVCTDVQADRERAAQGEVCPTGPIVGDRMRQSEADALALEQRIITPLIQDIDLRRARSLGEGTRRALRLRVAELSHQLETSLQHSTNSSIDEGEISSSTQGFGEHGAAIEVRFVLPKGAYATTVLDAVVSVKESRPAREDEADERDTSDLEED